MQIILIFVLFLINGALNIQRSAPDRTARVAFIRGLMQKKSHLEGKIKLKGGSNPFEGNVYIYHAGRWGAVCDDSWDNNAAKVICQMFNRSGEATQGSRFGIAEEKYWMDDIICDGTEGTITHCIFAGWGVSDCTPVEAAGVICQKDIVPEVMDEKPMKKLHEVVDVNATHIRLSGGSQKSEGRVEIFVNNTWGSICPDGWTIYEATIVCRHLGLGFASQAAQTDFFGNSQILLSGLQCEGNETDVFSCRHDEIGNITCPGEKGHVAAVVCTTQLADLVLDGHAIEATAHLQDVPMYQLKCAMEENCLSKSAYAVKESNPNWLFETRRLLRFTASSLNIGNAEFKPYLPKNLWQWHLCHMHYHSMEVFATFDIIDGSGRRVAQGHKASFCLEDNTCLPGVERKYSCRNYGDQGISVNCSDVYQYNIDCQWIDISDVCPGFYKLKVAINPHARIAEQQYHNNAVSCDLVLAESYVSVTECKHDRP